MKNNLSWGSFYSLSKIGKTKSEQWEKVIDMIKKILIIILSLILFQQCDDILTMIENKQGNTGWYSNINEKRL